MAEATTARDLLEDARGLLQQGESAKLLALVTSLHPADLGDLVLLLEPDERTALVAHLPLDLTGKLFEFAEDTGELNELIAAVALPALPAILATVPDDVAVDVLQRLDVTERAAALSLLGKSRDLSDLLEYEEESAGGIMSRGYVALNERMTAQQAIAYLRHVQPSSAQTYYLYVVDDQQKLIGHLNIRELLVNPPSTLIGELANRDIHSVTTDTDQEEVARLLQRYNLLALPVLDEDRRLVGVTLAEDLIDVVREEATEDMYRMVGLDEEETEATPFRRTVQLRLPWLIVNVFAASVGGFVVTQFESTLERAVVLAVFMPIVANQSGVTGTQTATIVVRTLAVRGTVTKFWQQLLRELGVGLTNGFVVGLILGIAGTLVFDNLTLGFVLLATMTLSSAFASIVGQVVPVALRAAGADPALASSIFVTMLTDSLAFLILLGTAATVISQLD